MLFDSTTDLKQTCGLRFSQEYALHAGFGNVLLPLLRLVAASFCFASCFPAFDIFLPPTAFGF